jgi:hypothetical protein
MMDITMTGSSAVWARNLSSFAPHLLFNRLLLSAAGGIFFLFQHPLLYRAQLSGRPKPLPGQHADPSANGLSPVFRQLGRHLFVYRAPIHHAPPGRGKTLRHHGVAVYLPSPTGALSWASFGCPGLYALLLAITGLYSLAFASPETGLGAIALGYLGLLPRRRFSGPGLVLFLPTENQIIAAIIAFSLLLLFWIIGWYEELGPPGYQGFFKYISTMGHFDAFSRGILDTRDILYYLGFIFFFLFLTKRQLESRQWRG